MVDIRSQLIADEGRELVAYQDTRGLWTIGIGHLLGSAVPPRLSSGITDQECEALFSADMGHVEHLLSVYEPWWLAMASNARTGVILNMGFNLGVPGLAMFNTFLGLLRAERWEDAATDLRSTHVYAQLPNRYERLAVQIEGGQWQ